MSQNPRDDIYSNPLERMVDFRFDEQVARVFPDMIQRSVPGYGTVINLLGIVAGRFAQPDSRVYDLGCSLGATTLAMRRRVAHLPDCRMIAVDNAPAMARGCREHVLADHTAVPVDVVCADVRHVEVVDASLVVLNFTLQFLEPQARQALVGRIHRGLRPGGALVVSEKLRFDDPRQQDVFTELHHGYKRANGYSDLEIAQKRQALENVLVPDTEQVHEQRLAAAGFTRVYRWFQSFNFASWLAIRD